MDAGGVTREAVPGGGVRLRAGDCTFEYRRPVPGALLVTITGLDTGQFGTATLDEIATALGREGRLELFVDARDAIVATGGVSDEWTRFFTAQQERLARVHVLVGSKVVGLTVAMAQHLSRTGSLIQIYSDPAIFGSRLALAERR